MGAYDSINEGIIGTIRNWASAAWDDVTVGTSSSVSKPIDLPGGEEIRISATMTTSTDWNVNVIYYASEAHNTAIRTQNVSDANGADAQVNATVAMAYPYAEVEFENDDGSNAGTLSAVVQAS